MGALLFLEIKLLSFGQTDKEANNETTGHAHTDTQRHTPLDCQLRIEANLDGQNLGESPHRTSFGSSCPGRKKFNTGADGVIFFNISISTY